MEYFLLGLEFFVTLWLLCGACTSRYLQRPEEGSDSLGLELKMVLDISFCHHGNRHFVDCCTLSTEKGA